MKLLCFVFWIFKREEERWSLLFSIFDMNKNQKREICCSVFSHWNINFIFLQKKDWNEIWFAYILNYFEKQFLGSREQPSQSKIDFGIKLRARLNLLTFSNLNSSCMFSWWLFSDAFLYLGIGLLLMFRNMALDKKILEPYLAGESWSKKRQWTGLKRGWILLSSTYLQRNWIKTLLRFFSSNHRDFFSSNHRDLSRQITRYFSSNHKDISRQISGISRQITEIISKNYKDISRQITKLFLVKS